MSNAYQTKPLRSPSPSGALKPRSGGRRLGEFRTHLAFNPFVVRDPHVVFEKTPFVLRGSPPEPAKLRAYSLRNGREAWNVEVREIVYRGPYPP